jgi:hypothetical protein
MHPAVRAVVLCDRVREKLASLTPGHNGLALAFVVSFFQSLWRHSKYSVERAKTEAPIPKPSPALGLRALEASCMQNAHFVHEKKLLASSKIGVILPSDTLSSFSQFLVGNELPARNVERVEHANKVQREWLSPSRL